MRITTNTTFPVQAGHTFLSLLFVCTASMAEEAVVAQTEPAVIPAHSRVRTATIGISDMTDTSVPGQEISQRDVPVSFSWEDEQYRFEFSIPYIRRTAPSGKIAKSHHHESKNDPAIVAPIVATSGLGDITAALTYTLLDEKDAPVSLSAKGEIKLGTADMAAGLGTGVNDYFGELNVSKSVGNFTASAELGYAIIGSPGEVEINDVKKSIYFKNIFFGSLGGAYQFADSFNAGMKLDMGQAIEAGGLQQRDLTLSLEYRFSKKRSIEFHAVRSLTPGIVSRGFGASFSTAM